MSDSAPSGKTARVIAGDSAQTAFQRWELPNLLTADQMERIQKQAHAEGFQAGRAEGLAAVGAELGTRVAELERMLALLAEPLRELDETMEQELVALAMSAARLIVRRELKTDPAQVLAAVREAMGALPAASRNVRLHLHPEDAVLVRERLKVSADEQTWRIVEDPVIARGGCKVITDTSLIDASVEARFLALMAGVLGVDRQQDKPKHG
jgi:flagellar assembly protein FliH